MILIGSSKPSAAISLDPERNRTFSYWHIFIPGLQPGQLYGYRVSGPFAPQLGMRYDPAKVLVDPYTQAIAYDHYQRSAAMRLGEDNLQACLKSVVVDMTGYDWEGDQPLRRPADKSLIYELHVGGFTRHPNSGVSMDRRGTYAGLIEKIPYLQELGIQTVELMPVQQFDPQAAPQSRPNYWGYQPSLTLLPIEITAHGAIRWVRWTSSATWSKRCTAPGSR